MAKNSFVAKLTFNHPIITESVTPWWILVQKTEWIYVSISIYLSIYLSIVLPIYLLNYSSLTLPMPIPEEEKKLS